MRAKFLRASWQGRAAPFTLSEVLAEPAPTQAEPPRSQLEVSVQAAADKPDEYKFDFSSRAPIDRVNIKLPQTNAYAHIVSSSRDRS